MHEVFQKGLSIMEKIRDSIKDGDVIESLLKDIFNETSCKKEICPKYTKVLEALFRNTTISNVFTKYYAKNSSLYLEKILKDIKEANTKIQKEKDEISKMLKNAEMQLTKVQFRNLHLKH